MSTNMARIREYISIISISFGVIGVLGIVCAYTSSIPAAETSYQWLWCGRMMMVYCILASIGILVSEKGIAYFHESVEWGLVFMGGTEAVWGLLQIYGFYSSNHSLYAVTGSFFNPGPYSGYLALTLPVCLHKYLLLRSKPDRNMIENIACVFVISVILLLLAVIPAGMSRSAWIASAVSCLFVYGMYHKWLLYVKKMWRSHRCMITGAVFLLLMMVSACGVGMYRLKPDSAIGRMFIWKISCMAVAEKPLTGHGTGKFIKAYGISQENYFSSGMYSENEERVAGCPEYAFNEYLRVATEYGIPALLLLLAGIICCIRCGLRKHRIGICGALVSLSIFAFASYPMEFPCFIVSFVFLIMACITGRSLIVPFIFTVITGIAGVQLVRTNEYDSCVSWSNCRLLYNTGASGVAKEEYGELYMHLKNRPRFLFDYGRVLYKEKDYVNSIKILKEANALSCDPMIMNIIAKNYHELKEYKKAEEWLIKSTNMLPGRIYPYYLLARLYANSGFYDYDKFREMAYIVMTKEPKVKSTAIDEMRNEIKKMLADEKKTHSHIE